MIKKVAHVLELSALQYQNGLNIIKYIDNEEKMANFLYLLTIACNVLIKSGVILENQDTMSFVNHTN